jgi:hypothetical protein
MSFASPPKQRKDLTFGTREKGADVSCRCYLCKGEIKFQAPSELVDAFVSGKVALFVGAGVSTESPQITETSTFYERISYILGEASRDISFPDLMEKLCLSPAGRTGLIQEIQAHFDYIKSYPAIYSQATRFHKELATFYPIDTIITTNWDTYFENECGAIPFVNDTDIPLWEVAKRRVLKIHGTIANYGSIVATRTDYQLCGDRLNNGVLGKLLSSLLATRTVVFIGYSLRDEDFLQIYNATRTSLADFHRRAYFVSPNITEDDRLRLEQMNLHVIETDGTFFISKIKEHACSIRCIAKDQMYDSVAAMLEAVFEENNWLRSNFSIQRHPQYLISAWYLDGMQHALERILRLRETGTYSDLHRLQYSARNYFGFAKRYLRDQKFDDAAYCEGFANGMVFATLDPDGDLYPPVFFYFGGFATSSRTKYRRSISRIPSIYKRANKYLRKIADDLKGEDEDFVIVHRARLSWTEDIEPSLMQNPST